MRSIRGGLWTFSASPLSRKNHFTPADHQAYPILTQGETQHKPKPILEIDARGWSLRQGNQPKYHLFLGLYQNFKDEDGTTTFGSNFAACYGPVAGLAFNITRLGRKWAFGISLFVRHNKRESLCGLSMPVYRRLDARLHLPLPFPAAG